MWLDLGLLFSLVLMGMLVFGSLAYYIENEEEDTGFYSIPQVNSPTSLLRMPDQRYIFTVASVYSILCTV